MNKIFWFKKEQIKNKKDIGITAIIFLILSMVFKWIHYLEGNQMILCYLSTVSLNFSVAFFSIKDGIQYTTTLTKQLHGVIKTTSQFSVNLGKEALTNQIKDLRKQGYKQREIADMLKVSQATVSKYLKK